MLCCSPASQYVRCAPPRWQRPCPWSGLPLSRKAHACMITKAVRCQLEPECIGEAPHVCPRIHAKAHCSCTPCTPTKGDGLLPSRLEYTGIMVQSDAPLMAPECVGKVLHVCPRVLPTASQACMLRRSRKCSVRTMSALMPAVILKLGYA